jgi:hypothetical protein
MKKRKATAVKITFRATPQTRVISVVQSKDTSIITKSVVDPENPRTKKYSESLLFTGVRFFKTLVGIKNPKSYRTLKNNSSIVSIKDMSYETRSRIFHFVRFMGAASSGAIAASLGFVTARQVGQFRRWNFGKNWREYTNR